MKAGPWDYSYMLNNRSSTSTETVMLTLDLICYVEW